MGFVLPKDERRAMAAGFSYYITRQFDPVDVVAAVTRILNASNDKVA
jgi:CheY-like chemotaxis protein